MLLNECFLIKYITNQIITLNNKNLYALLFVLLERYIEYHQNVINGIIFGIINVNVNKNTFLLLHK